MTMWGVVGMGGGRLVCFHFENVTAEVEGERKTSEEATAPQPGRRSAATNQARCRAWWGVVWVKLLCFGGLGGGEGSR